MEQNLYKYIRQQKGMLHFLRRHPIWYRKLSHDETSFEEFHREMRIFYGKTMHQRVERVNQQLQMVDLIISLSKAMKD